MSYFAGFTCVRSHESFASTTGLVLRRLTDSEGLGDVGGVGLKLGDKCIPSTWLTDLHILFLVRVGLAIGIGTPIFVDIGNGLLFDSSCELFNKCFLFCKISELVNCAVDRGHSYEPRRDNHGEGAIDGKEAARDSFILMSIIF